MNSILLKESIYEMLKLSGYDVYEYTRVPKTASFPYVTYDLQGSIESLRDSGKSIVLPLNVDILDYKLNKNTDTIEDMTDTIDNLCDEKDVIETKFFYRLDRSTMLPNLPTPNENTFRRQIVYNLSYNERRL